MNKVFIGGSRRVSRLNIDVRSRIDRIMEQRFPILVGDANGADKAVQRYLHDQGYRLVEVFCAGTHCRNNVGEWPVRKVDVNDVKKSFAFYATKDREMANEATYGLMLWDGKSKGTLLNVLRLLRQEKKVVIYSSPSDEFSELKNRTDWDEFLSRCPAYVRERVQKEAVSEARDEQPPSQTSLFQRDGVG